MTNLPYLLPFVLPFPACYSIKIVKRPNDWRSCVYANVKRRVFMVN